MVEETTVTTSEYPDEYYGLTTICDTCGGVGWNDNYCPQCGRKIVGTNRNRQGQLEDE